LFIKQDGHTGIEENVDLLVVIIDVISASSIKPPCINTIDPLYLLPFVLTLSWEILISTNILEATSVRTL